MNGGFGNTPDDVPDHMNDAPPVDGDEFPPESGEPVYHHEPAEELPHNAQAEKALIGAILMDNRVFDDVSQDVKAHEFALESHILIYQAMETLFADGKAVDPITVMDVLENDGKLDHAGGVEYLAELAASSGTRSSARNYAPLIRESFTRRSLMTIAEDIRFNAVKPDGQKPSEMVEEAERALYRLTESVSAGKGARTQAQLVQDTLKQIEDRQKNPNALPGVTTGLKDLDDMLGGLCAPDLIILAGRPSMGKTTLALSIARRTAQKHQDTAGQEGAAVGFFSLEMSGEQIVQKVTSDISDVPLTQITKGYVKGDDWQKVADSAQSLTRLPLYVDDTPSLSVGDIRARSRQLKRERGIGLIIIDLLGHIKMSQSKDSMSDRIGGVLKELKALAKELNVPLILLHQLSRANEAREDKRPGLSDLRGSGDLEQDADVVLFVYRDHYYLSRAEPKIRDNEDQSKFQERLMQWTDRINDTKHIGEVLITKARMGEVGTVRLHFDGAKSRFADPERNY